MKRKQANKNHPELRVPPVSSIDPNGVAKDHRSENGKLDPPERYVDPRVNPDQEYQHDESNDGQAKHSIAQNAFP